MKLTFYGNLVLYLSVLIVALLNSLNILTPLLDKLGCGAVVLTISVIGFAGIAVIFDLVSIFYSLDIYFFKPVSPCKELQLFTMVCAYVFFFWLLLLVFKTISYIRNRNTLEENEYGLQHRKNTLSSV